MTKRWLCIVCLHASLWMTGSSYAATFQVEMINNTFRPATLTIDVGDTVVWIQRDITLHDTESTPAGVWRSPLLSRGQTFSFTFNTPGRFNYLCNPHASFMRGVIIVRTPPEPPVISQPGRSETGRFQFRVTGAAGRNFIIQASPDLMAWTDLGTFTFGSTPFLFVDENPIEGARYYRAFQP